MRKQQSFWTTRFRCLIILAWGSIPVFVESCLGQRSNFEMCGLFIVEIEQLPDVKVLSLLDTGSKKTMVDPGLATVIQTKTVDASRKTRVVLPDGTISFRDNCTMNISLEGGPRCTVEAVFLPVSRVGETIGVELSAIAGMDVMLHSPLCLRGSDGTVTHIDQNSLPDKVASPLRLGKGRLLSKMTVPVLGEMDVVLDTGATAAILLTEDQLEFLSRGGNAVRIPESDSKVVQADGSILTARRYILKEVVIAERKIRNVRASSASVPAIGMDLLRYMDLYLDGTSQRLWMIWNVKEGEENVRIGASGLRVGFFKSGALSILEVIADSVGAHAGMMAGDEVLSIDGSPAIEWTYYSVRDRFSQDGSVVRLECSRDGKPFTVEFELKHRFPYPPEWPPEREEFNPD